MKKVAYCLYGVPRLLKDGSKQIIKFVENQNNCEFDFYCQAWWDSNEVGTENRANEWVTEGFKNRLGTVKSDTDKKIVDLYNRSQLLSRKTNTYPYFLSGPLGASRRLSLGAQQAGKKSPRGKTRSRRTPASTGERR